MPLSRTRAPVVPWALVPAKRFGRAKSRLAAALPAAERRDLARALCRRALGACAGSGALAGTLVATDGDDVCALAERQRAAVLRDGERGDPSLAQVVDGALLELRARGATHALVIMADLPYIEARDVRELLALVRDSDVVIAPDALRTGTSALGLRIDLPFRTGFGHADSFQRHLREAQRLGARTRTLCNPRLAFDVDTTDDLARLAQSWASLRLPAARSLRALAVSAA